MNKGRLLEAFYTSVLLWLTYIAERGVITLSEKVSFPYDYIIKFVGSVALLTSMIYSAMGMIENKNKKK